MASASLVAFAGKSVAGPIIKEIVTKGFEYLNGYFNTESMKNMKSELEERMPQIQAVLDVVSPDRIMNNNDSKALDQWFWQLRDAVEAAEDAIDELEYYELEQKAEDEKVSDGGSSFVKMKHKVVKSVKHVSILDKTLEKFTHRDTREKLKKAMEGLNKVAAGTTKFLEVIERRKGGASGSRQQEDSTNNDRQTGSTETVTKFVGRTTEKKRILEWLTKKTSIEEAETIPSTNYIPVLSIVGHGGMGKTTLAQCICKQDEVVKDFKIIWVTVSNSFDATSVIRKILESATRAAHSNKDYEPLQLDLKEKLMSVRFLLILDDVWEEEKTNEWEKLFAPLRTGKSGSKILLTTRMESVAIRVAHVMGIKKESLALKELEEGENLDLFNHHVFSGVNPKDYGNLEQTGKKIARKLGGCPLVTKVVCKHLADNREFVYWKNFLQEGLAHFKGTEDDIMKVLRLSYNNLPTQSQVCFRYCSIFPQDYEFAKKELLQMWMGSGLISQATKSSETLEDIGERCLAQLTRKSFFDLKSGDLCDDDGKYVMHDLMHELATYVSSGECARIIYPARFEYVKDTVRHLSVSIEEVKEISRFKNLRTIIIRPNLELTVSEDIARMIANVVENSKALRLLQINLKVEHIPDIFANLKHLRYIKFRALSEGTSTEGLLKLYHLMVLLVASVRLMDRKEQKIQKKKGRQEKHFGYLDRLRYVTYGQGGFGEFPIGKLTSLQELNNYCVQGKKGNEISALGNLKSLRKLQVQGLENVEKPEEARNARLHEKRYLTSLSLEWSEFSANEESSYKVLHHLNPHDNVRELQISGYGGQSLPLWIESPSVKNLASIELRNCINLARLPSLEGLPLLNHIVLENLPKLQQIGQSSDASSSGCIDSSLPATVHTLTVKCCHELRELPILPPSLVYLEIDGVGLARLPRIGKLCSGSGETESCQLLRIRLAHCPSLTSLEGSLLMQKQYMGTLRVLDIRDCEHLECTALPFDEMIELRKLFVTNCPKLDARDKRLPLSLEILCIEEKSGHSEPPLLGSLLGLSNLSQLTLHRCSGLVSLPTTDVFKSLHSLKSFKIISCENLSSLGGLGSLASLAWLEIWSCKKLSTVGSSPTGGEEAHLLVLSSLQIGTLQIDAPSLLLAEPLKSLHHTKRLVIRSNMESLPMRWLQQNHASLRSLNIAVTNSLKSLPPSMPDLSCLEQLTIDGANSLKSLPDLPSSLRYLNIWPGRTLELKLVSQEGPERSKISHIPRVKIGRSYFTMGKSCSEGTYNGLS